MHIEGLYDNVEQDMLEKRIKALESNVTVTKKTWIGLTDAEIYKIVDDRTPVCATLEELTDFVFAVRDAEDKLKEKNGGHEN